MNISKLFEMQRVLDERIVKEKGLEGKDIFPNKVLALQVELGELANEWQGFKHWKVDPQPKEKMLEEYVDCLHFILSIGLELGFKDVSLTSKVELFSDNIVECFNDCLYFASDVRNAEYEMGYNFAHLFWEFHNLGQRLGFTWSQIEQAYFEKNKVNHERQGRGY